MYYPGSLKFHYTRTSRCTEGKNNSPAQGIQASASLVVRFPDYRRVARASDLGALLPARLADARPFSRSFTFVSLLPRVIT